MKRIILVVFAAGMLLTACQKEEVTEKTFVVAMNLVQSTSIRFEVFPENNDFFYNYILVPVSHYDSVGDDGVIAEFNTLFNELYIFLDSIYASQGSSFDHTLLHYDGAINGVDYDLMPNTPYYLCLIRLKKSDLSPIAPLHKTPFKTQTYQESDISFQVEANADTVVVIPSDLNDTYYYDYLTAEELRNRYYGYLLYFVQENIANFETYGYMSAMLSRGVEKSVPLDYYPNLSDNDTLYLAAVGYRVETNPTQYYFELVRRSGTYSVAPYQQVLSAPKKRAMPKLITPNRDAALPQRMGK